MASVPEIMERIRKAVHAQVKEGSAIKKALFNYAYDYKRKQVAVGGDSPIFNKLVFTKTKELLGGRLRAMISGRVTD
jgi:long-chain acyl-CoA synthetase